MTGEAFLAAWQVVVISGVGPALLGVWKIFHWLRSDRRQDRLLALSVSDRLQSDLLAQRQALSREQAELFDRMRVELSRCQARLLEIERDRERGWDLARHWHKRSHELRHAALNAQAIVAGFCARDDLAVPSWPDMEVTLLEEPV